MKHLLLIVSSFLMLNSTVSIAGLPPALLPQTGQTLCYDATGATIDCAGTGQDGELQNGLQWPSIRFVDNSVANSTDQTVTDNLTGLIWTKDAYAPGPPVCIPSTNKNWQGALDYVACLNSNYYLGKTDWRMPNFEELYSLLNDQQSNSATWLTSQGFYNIHANSGYWSSSTTAQHTNYVWVANLGLGILGGEDKSADYLGVWPVSGGQRGIIQLPNSGQTDCWNTNGASISCIGTGQDGALRNGATWPVKRFNGNGDGTIIDNLTGLMWSEDANPTTTSITWQGALDYIKTLNSQSWLGYNDWRLPSRKEMYSLVDKQQSDPATWLNSKQFSNAQSGFYWSGSSVAYRASEAWIVDMGPYLYYTSSKDSKCYVLPVRGGQYWSLDSLIISTSPKFGAAKMGATTQFREVEISNRDANSYTITHIAISGTNSTEFSITTGGSNPCISLTPTLAAGTSCSLLLGFNPAFSGLKNASLGITTNGTTNSISLSGVAISTVYGTIIDQATGLPIPGASVKLNTSATVTTDSKGYYSFGSLPSATYSITVTKSGYQFISKSGIVVSATASAKTDILLPTTGLLNITSAMLPSATAGEVYASRVMVAGGTGPYTFNKVYGTLPTGLLLDTTTGMINGTPIGSGSYTFAIGVTDSATGYVEKEFNIDLVPSLQIITNTLPFTSFPDPSYFASIVATGGKGNLTFSLASGTLPYSLIVNSTGEITTYTEGGMPLPPPEGTVITGIFEFYIKVTDATGRTAQKKFSINSASAMNFITYTMKTGVTNCLYSYIVAATGGYGAYTWSLTSGSLPVGLALNTATGVISGTTNNSGSYPLGITIKDAIGRKATASYTLNIAEPLTVSTVLLPSTYKGATYNIALQASGGLAPLNYYLTGTLPAGLTFDNANGIISGTPIASGLSNLSFTITDSSYPTPQTASKTLPLRVWSSQPYTFTVNMTGNGSGTVTSDSGGMACTSGTCSAELPGNMTVNLFATPNYTSLFGGWSGDCVGLGDCSITLTDNKSITATFTAAPKTKVGTKPFDTLQLAYDDAATTSNSIIKLLEGSLANTLTAGRSISVNLEGGYNAAYDAISIETTIQGPLKIRAGTVRVKGVNVK